MKTYGGNFEVSKKPRLLRFAMLTPVKGQSFIKWERDRQRDVQDGVLTIEEFGFLTLLALRINPHNGYLLTNFSLLAGEFNLDQERVRTMCRKLLRLGKIFFKLAQGQRKKAQFYVLGLEIAHRKVVGQEFVDESEAGGRPTFYPEGSNVSEVPTPFPKLKRVRSHSNQSGSNTLHHPDSEVSYKEKEKEKKKEIEKENETAVYAPLLQKLNNPKPLPKSLKDVSPNTIKNLKDSLGVEKTITHLLTHGYDPDEVQRVFEAHRE